MSLVLYDTYIPTPLELVRTEDKLLKTNYTADQFLSFLHNVSYYATRINRSWNCILEPKEVDDSDPEVFEIVPGLVKDNFTAMRHVQMLTPCNGLVRVAPTQKEKRLLKEAIDKVYNIHFDTLAILDTLQNIVYHSIMIPSLWVRNVIKSIITSSEYISDDIVFTNQNVESFEDAYIPLITRLLAFYTRGCIALEQDDIMIKEWELEPVPDYKGLYQSSWRNSLLAPDISLFLLRVSHGQTSFEIKLPKHIMPDPIQSGLVRGDAFNNYFRVIATNYNDAAISVKGIYS